MTEALQLQSEDASPLRYKIVPSRGPSLHVVGRAQADALAHELATELEAGVAICEDPPDNPHGFRRVRVVPAPKKPKVR